MLSCDKDKFFFFCQVIIGGSIALSTDLWKTKKHLQVKLWTVSQYFLVPCSSLFIDFLIEGRSLTDWIISRFSHSILVRVVDIGLHDKRKGVNKETTPVRFLNNIYSFHYSHNIVIDQQEKNVIIDKDIDKIFRKEKSFFAF